MAACCPQHHLPFSLEQGPRPARPLWGLLCSAYLGPAGKGLREKL